MVKAWRPHGIIGGITLRRLERGLKQLGIPVVDTANVLPGLRFPVVDVDPEALGRMAAEYFLERGFCNFGFYGSETAVYSRLQQRAFMERVQEAGYSVSVCFTEYLAELASTVLWQKTARQTRRWLRSLQRPVAIFCCDDTPARILADACTQIGLLIPQEVALLGLGNDELECTLTRPLLSSIAVPSERVGYEAAKLLDQIMSGEVENPDSVFLPPLYVVTRQSTDTMAVEDQLVREALQYIHQHAAEDLGVGQLAREIAVSRRSLERRFRQVLGRSVLEEIYRVRIDQAKQLLLGTNMSIALVASRTGFSGVRHLDVVFRKFTGSTPTGFRRQFQLG